MALASCKLILLFQSAAYSTTPSMTYLRVRGIRPSTKGTGRGGSGLMEEATLWWAQYSYSLYAHRIWLFYPLPQPSTCGKKQVKSLKNTESQGKAEWFTRNENSLDLVRLWSTKSQSPKDPTRSNIMGLEALTYPLSISWIHLRISTEGKLLGLSHAVQSSNIPSWCDYIQ